MAHSNITIHFRLLTSGRPLDFLSVSPRDTAAHLCQLLKLKLQASGEAGPVVKIVFNDTCLSDIGRDSQHYHVSLAAWNIVDGSVLDVVLSKPPPTCAWCDASGGKVDEDGDIDVGQFPELRLHCCQRRLCTECFQRVQGERCPFDDCARSNFSANLTSGSRSNWGGPALSSSRHIEHAQHTAVAEGNVSNLADGTAVAEGNVSDPADGSETIPERSAQDLACSNDRWLILFDLNGTFLFRPRQGASVEGAQSMVTEFPDGGYNGKPYRIYHRRGLSNLLAHLIQAPSLEWGFCTTQMAQNAVPSVRALLKESLGVEVEEVEGDEARLALKGGGVDQTIWAFDQNYCLDDPSGEVYENTRQPVQVFDIKTKVLSKCGHRPERTLVVASEFSRLKCSLCEDMWVPCKPFDETAVCDSDEDGLADLLQRLTLKIEQLGS